MSEECLNILDKWLLLKKNEIYAENIKADNDETELQAYSDSLEDFALTLIDSIDGEYFDTLNTLGWPKELMGCITDMGIRVDIIHDIRSSFITYPFNRNEIHKRELLRENAGLE